MESVGLLFCYNWTYFACPIAKGGERLLKGYEIFILVKMNQNQPQVLSCHLFVGFKSLLQQNGTMIFVIWEVCKSANLIKSTQS